MNMMQNPPPEVSDTDQRFRGSSSASQMSVRWTTLHDAASAVAMLAGLPPEKASPEIRNFPALMRDITGWRKELAERQISDLAAIMQPGLTALLAVNARGLDAQTPARTLWQEFYASREAILGLLPPGGSMGPRRSA
ncbi:MAG: hypothetical protein ACK5NN_03340 [Sphingomonadaceae bacterium]